MKTLKQLREEVDDTLFLFVELSPSQQQNEMMLEGHIDQSKSTIIPSSKDMPAYLTFRRLQYRIFPDRQVVALYYSKMIDKYLSIPFGPGKNLNLSEAIILEEHELDEDWQKTNRRDNTSGMSQKAVDAYRRENPGSKLQTAVTEKNPKGKRAARRKSFCSRMGGMKKRLTSAKTANDPDSRINKALRRWNCEESFRAKLEEKRQERLDEFIMPVIRVAGSRFAQGLMGMTGRAMSKLKPGSKNSIPRNMSKDLFTGKKSDGSKKGFLDKAKDYIKDKIAGAGQSDSNQEQQQQQQKQSPSEYIDATKSTGKIRAGHASRISTWDLSRDKSQATRQSRLQTADQVYARNLTRPQTNPVQENKMSDLREMIDTNTQFKSLNINGREVNINIGMAKRILEVYDSVNHKNKKIVESMLNENLESFKKLLNFSIRN